jgi:hypothetical protein
MRCARDESKQDDFPGTTEHNHAKNHMNRMFVDNENVYAVVGEFLLESSSAQKERRFKLVDEKNFCDNCRWSRSNCVLMALLQFLGNQKRFFNCFRSEMKKGSVESTKTEIAANRVNYTSSRISEIVNDSCLVFFVTMTSNGSAFFRHPTLVSPAFHTNVDGIDLV